MCTHCSYIQYQVLQIFVSICPVFTGPITYLIVKLKLTGLVTKFIASSNILSVKSCCNSFLISLYIHTQHVVVRKIYILHISSSTGITTKLNMDNIYLIILYVWALWEYCIFKTVNLENYKSLKITRFMYTCF